MASSLMVCWFELYRRRGVCASARPCTWVEERIAFFALIHSSPILPELVAGDNRHVLPVFWRFCPIAKTVGGRCGWRLSSREAGPELAQAGKACR